MSGIGPVEPGEDTYAADSTPPLPPPRSRPVAFAAGHRGLVVATACAAALATTASYLYATRSTPPTPPPAPWPGQAVSVGYLGTARTGEARRGAFDYTLAVSVVAGPPVTVERVTQTSRSLWISTVPATPFTVSLEKPREILVVIHVRDCQEVPRNAQLPFIDMTLRNTLTTQQHSYILGNRYAWDLSRALDTVCPAGTPPGPATNTTTSPAGSPVAPRKSRLPDGP